MTVKIKVSLLEVENKNIQLTFSRNFGIELTQRPCRSISRVGKQRLPCPLACQIDALKYRTRHINLTANGQVQGLGKLHGNRKDRTQILCNVLAHKTVAAGSPLHKYTVFVTQRYRKTINFGFDGIYCIGNGPGNSFQEFAQFIKREYIGKRIHLHRVRYLFKFIKWLAAHTLRR